MAIGILPESTKQMIREIEERLSLNESQIDRTAPQPAPVVEENARAIWPVLIVETEDAARTAEQMNTPASVEHARVLRLVAADMKKRHEFGLAKYGVPLVADNGRDQISDAYQEALDGVVYTKAAIESDAFVALHPVERENVISAHGRFEEACWLLRKVLARRDGR